MEPEPHSCAMSYYGDFPNTTVSSRAPHFFQRILPYRGNKGGVFASEPPKKLKRCIFFPVRVIKGVFVFCVFFFFLGGGGGGGRVIQQVVE